MRAGGREVEVRGHERARPDEEARKQVLRTAALMCRDQMAVAVDVLHRGLEPEEAARARVRLVSEFHRRALLLRHRRRPAVGEQVDEDIVRATQKRVVARLLHRLAAPLCIGEEDRLDDLDLPRRNAHAPIVALAPSACIRRAPNIRAEKY
jgi:hypothetical protein